MHIANKLIVGTKDASAHLGHDAWRLVFRDWMV